MSSNVNVQTDKATSSETLSLDERTLCGDDEKSDNGRPSSEISEDDHDILESEDERERLLTKPEGVSGLFGQPKVRIGRRGEKTPNRQRHASKSEESSALMYDTEEAVGGSDSGLSRHSSDSGEQRLLAARTQRKVLSVGYTKLFFN
jgi:hypothetical protein